MVVLICLIVLAAAGLSTSLPTTTTTTTESSVSTDKPFKPSLQLSTSLELKDITDGSKEVADNGKNKRAFGNQLGVGFDTKSASARSFQLVRQQHPYRFYTPPRHGDVQHARQRAPSHSTSAAGKPNGSQRDDADAFSQHPNSLDQQVQPTLQHTQNLQFLNPYQNTISPALLAMAMANSPFFNGGLSPYSFGGALTPQPRPALFTPHPAMFQAMNSYAGFAPFLNQNPLPYPLPQGQGPFGLGALHSIPVIILRVGENHQTLGADMILLHPRYNPAPLNIPSLLQTMLQNPNTPHLPMNLHQPPQTTIQDNIAHIVPPLNSVHAGLTTKPNFSDHRQYNNLLLPTPQTETLKTEVIVNPMQHIEHPYQHHAYENYVEKA